MLRTLLANPNIRYLVLCGNDRTGSGDDVVNLFESGRKLDTVLDQNLRKDLVEKIRNNVELIDMRGNEAGIKRKISSLERKPPHSKPVIVKESDRKSHVTNVKYASGFRIEGDTISETWLKIVNIVMKFGEYKKSQHGMDQKEVLNTLAIIEDGGVIAEWLPFDRKGIEEYYETFFGVEADKGLSYTYGKRLFKYLVPDSEKKWEEEARATFNQIENAVRHLKKTPHTRRAAAFTWYVREDGLSENPPCLTQITWNIKYGRFFQTAVFRSHDIFSGWPMNAFALRELQKSMASELGIEAGPMTILSNSAHIYENNFSQASDIIKKYHTRSPDKFKEDKLGYFIIGIEKGEIVVRHHLPDHTESEFTFTGKGAEELYKEIMHEDLVSRNEHAAYLGMELARAEDALKRGEKYIQQ